MKIAPLLALLLMAGSCGNGTKPPDPPPVIPPPPQESTYVTLAGAQRVQVRFLGVVQDARVSGTWTSEAGLAGRFAWVLDR